MSEVILGCLDPGHSEYTPGKGAGAFREYKSNRDIAIKLKRLLEATGRFKIIFSVDLEEPIDKRLRGRAQVAINAGCKFFISIHSNAASDTRARGTETYIDDNTSASVPFAQAVHNSLVAALGTRDRGVKRANFGVLDATYKHMLSCLTEGEFFTNPEARAWMLTEDYSNKYAEGVANGLCRFYNVAPVKETTPKAPTKPAAPKVEPSSDEGKQLIKVKVGQLWTYSSANWNDKAVIVNKDEVFTAMKGPFAVGGGHMYQLKSGLYITASSQYVEVVGTVKSISKQPAPVNKMVRVEVGSLWTYNSKNWDDKAKVVEKGEAFTVVGDKIKVGSGYMYQLKSGLYITANSQYISIV